MSSAPAMSYMFKPGSSVCARCGEECLPSNMIHAQGVRRSTGENVSHDICQSCWWAHGNQHSTGPAFDIPAPKHPMACLAASSHKTCEAAQVRADKVAFHLGKRPEIKLSRNGSARPGVA